MIRPTVIPQTLKSLLLEQAVAREALRLGLAHHKTIATRLKGLEVKRTIDDIFEQALEETYIKMMNIDIIAGTGGLLSHAPRRIQSMVILTDAFQPEGITWMFQDSVFMMPHLGVLSTVYQEAAWNIFDKDCLVRLGTVIAPNGTGNIGDNVMTVEIIQENTGKETKLDMSFGEIKKIDIPEGQEAKIIISPRRRFDVGAGNGNKIESTAMGGVAGILLDARGRPLLLPEDKKKRIELQLECYKNLDLYPESLYENLI
jgi:hypothetical protein